LLYAWVVRAPYALCAKQPRQPAITPN